MNIRKRGQNFAIYKRLPISRRYAERRFALRIAGRLRDRSSFEELQASYDQTSAIYVHTGCGAGKRSHTSAVSPACWEKNWFNGDPARALKENLLHDIGKIGINDIILHKPASVDDEWKIMQPPRYRCAILERIPFLQESMPVVRYHHERWDGSGYPLGLQERDIPLQARIFSVVDVFDALTSRRSYRKKSSPDEAIQYLRDQSGILFDPDVVEALAKLPYAQFIEGNELHEVQRPVTFFAHKLDLEDQL
jgi:hypothetical protein